MKEEIQKALEVLRSGGMILYPTDTVWGIGCDATNPEAVAKIYSVKRREDSKSLVLLASDMDMICRYVQEVPEMAVQLVEVNDKPMTIIYPGAIVGEKPSEPGAAVRADRNSLAYNTVAEDGTFAFLALLKTPISSSVRRSWIAAAAFAWNDAFTYSTVR